MTRSSAPLSDDLPATVVRVELPHTSPPVLPPLRHLVAFTGTLELDTPEGTDGRNVPLRLVVSRELYQACPPLSVTNFVRVTPASPVLSPDSLPRRRGKSDGKPALT